jgi:hypothetical protein
MDRVLASDGALVQSTDILNTNKFGMVAHAFLARAILGVPTAVDGLACNPTTPASLQVTVGVGSIYAADLVDATAYNDLGVDSNTIVKQGILYNPVTLTITPPTTAGYSQVFLVQVILQDVDTGSMVVSYYNPAILTNPLAQPFAGPNNSGQSQFTIRSCACAIQLKPGAAAPSGTQTAPAPDPGNAGLYAITVANGQATISSTNIVQLANAPFIDPGAKLPQIPTSAQYNKWTYVVDTGSPSALVVKTNPVLTGYGPAGLMLLVKAAAAPVGAATINVDGLGLQPVVNIDGSNISQGQWSAGSILVLLWDGSRFQYVSSSKQPGAPIYLQSSLTIYVNSSTGSDTLYDGSSPTVSGSHGPFATIQRAANQVPSYNLNGNTINISVANGAYSGVILPQVNGSGTVIITGNTVSPTSCTVTGTNQSAFLCPSGNSGAFTIQGFAVSASGSKIGDPISGITCSGNGLSVIIGTMSFGACVGSHIYISNGAVVTNGASCTWIITASGNGSFLSTLTPGSQFLVNPAGGPSIVVANAVSFSNGFVTAVTGSLISLIYTSLTNPGNVTGAKYSAASNAIINTNGAGANYFPGTLQGNPPPPGPGAPTGGQYI